MEPARLDVEWDEAKRLVNLAKHGIDFVDASALWLSQVWTRPSRHAGEERYVSTGLLVGRVAVVIWTVRERRRRLISARIARRDEREDYAGFLERHRRAQGSH